MEVFDEAAEVSARREQQRSVVQAEASFPQGADAGPLFQLQKSALLLSNSEASGMGGLAQYRQPNDTRIKRQ